MPKQAIDYSRCVIYKLCCKDPLITDEYYGHTTDKIKRKCAHKIRCNNPNSNGYNIYVYQFIRENGGWENWDMIVVEEFSCENKNQAEQRERHWIETQQATLNKIIPTRTIQEYYQENWDRIQIRNKKYYEENKEEISKYKKQYKKDNNIKCECECGGKYTSSHKSTHLKTKKHINFFK